MVKHTISGSCTKPDAEGEPCNPIVKNLLIRKMLMKSLYWLCCSTSYFLDVLVHAVVVSHAEVPIQTHSRIGLWLWWSQWLSIMVWIQTSSLWPPCGKIICFCLCRQWIKKTCYQGSNKMKQTFEWPSPILEIVLWNTEGSEE